MHVVENARVEEARSFYIRRDRALADAALFQITRLLYHLFIFIIYGFLFLH